MEKGTTIFYHKHIQTNIDRLDERKDKFMHYRLGFLKEYYHPIQQKIEDTRADILKEQHTLENIQQIIQNQEQIASLKKQLAEYHHTNQYFHSKVQQYQKKSIEFEQYNQLLRIKIKQLKTQLGTHKEQLAYRLPLIIPKTQAHERQTIQKSNENYSTVLPTIEKNSPQALSTRESRIKPSARKRIIGIGQKIQKYRLNHTQHVCQSAPIREDIKNQNIQEHREVKKKLQELREKITKFNKIQVLFKQCFETKKASVQKWVSQLQSKLIANRQEFLNTCQALGSKETSVSFQQFAKLSPDEIVTLFISFVWLNRKLFGEFSAKRRRVIELTGKLPKN